MTKQQKLIYHIVQNSCEHWTADQIFQRAREEMPSIAIGTVYRNLNSMVENGQIRRISMSNGPDRFDRTLEDHNHLFCAGCGQISDINLDQFKAELQKEIGAPILSFELNVEYLCPKCRAAKEDTRTTQEDAAKPGA